MVAEGSQHMSQALYDEACSYCQSHGMPDLDSITQPRENHFSKAQGSWMLRIAKACICLCLFLCVHACLRR